MSNNNNTYTPEQVINLLNTDLNFGINFIIDNNPEGVQSRISSLNIPLTQNPPKSVLRQVIDDLMSDGSNPNAQSNVEFILSVPYKDTAQNYTGNFGDYFRSVQISQGGNIQKDANLIIASLSGILGSVADVWVSFKQQDYLETQQDMREEYYKYNLDKIERTKVFGIPQGVFYAMVGFVAILVIVSMMAKNRK